MMRPVMAIDPNLSSKATLLSGVAFLTASKTSEGYDSPKTSLYWARNMSLSTSITSKTRTLPSRGRISTPASSACRVSLLKRSLSAIPISLLPLVHKGLQLRYPLEDLLLLAQLQLHRESAQVDVQDLGADGAVAPFDAALKNVFCQLGEPVFYARQLPTRTTLT